MRTRMFAVSAGMIWVGFWPELLPWIPILLLALVFLGLARVVAVGFRGIAEVLLCCGLLLAGTCWHLVYAGQRLEQRLPIHLEGVDLRVQGFVASMPEPRPAGQRFQFVLDNAEGPFCCGRLLLNSYGHHHFKAGQRWQLVVRLQQPHGAANPGSFDYEAWLFQQGISARGYVRNSEANRQLAAGGRSLLSLRGAIRERLLEVTDGLAFQSVLLALTLGERSLLTDDQWALFSDTGTNHLVVISGLHVVLVATLVGIIVSKGWRHSVRLMSLLPAQQAAGAAGIIAAFLYSALSGFALPTQRAMIMVAVYMSARLLSLHGNNWISFQLAMLLVLLVDPLAATGAGFWLSFTAVASLLLVQKEGRIASGANSKQSFALRMVMPQLAVFVGLLVPLGYWQGQVSLLAPLANMIAIPAVGWLVVPASLLASLVSGISPTASQWLFSAANQVFSWLFGILESLVLLADSTQSLSVNPLTQGVLVLAALGALLCLLPGYGNSRWLALLLLSPLISSDPPDTNVPADKVLELAVLDVGQGLAVVVRTANHALVYDTGPRFSSGFDSGAAIVFPVLRHLGVKRIDLLIVSHGDNDHAGGVGGLLASMPVARIVAGEPLDQPSEAVEACVKNDSWSWDGVEFRFLHPAAGSSFQGNNSSCVLLVDSGDFQLLLPGDIDAGIERQLLQQPWFDDRLEVLVSAHHGSNTSSALSFLARVRPQLVIHSAGYRNQFGHPTSRVTERIERLGGSQLETASSGMVRVELKRHRQGVEVRQYREDVRRYWHWSNSR